MMVVLSRVACITRNQMRRPEQFRCGCKFDLPSRGDVISLNSGAGFCICLACLRHRGTSPVGTSADLISVDLGSEELEVKGKRRNLEGTKAKEGRGSPALPTCLPRRMLKIGR